MKQIYGQTLAQYIGGARGVANIVWGRVNGKALEELVPTSRISSSQSRIDNEKNNEKTNVTNSRGNFYRELVQ